MNRRDPNALRRETDRMARANLIAYAARADRFEQDNAVLRAELAIARRDLKAAQAEVLILRGYRAGQQQVIDLLTRRCDVLERDVSDYASEAN